MAADRRVKRVAASEFAAESAGEIREAARAALAERGVFHVALAGGSTPLAVYAHLAEQGGPFDGWRFWFGDERCVGPEDERSNFRAAREAWFRPARLPASSVRRIEGERPPEEAAAAYCGRLRELPRDPLDRPVLDLVLLGLGTDGHTASLFPGTAALAVRDRDAVAVEPGAGREARVTLTVPTLAAARRVRFLVAGEGKAGVLRDLLEGDADLPARHVAPDSGDLAFVVDEAAAARLSAETPADPRPEPRP